MMEKLKFALLSIVILSLLGILGYWSVATIQSGSENAAEQKIKRLEKENESLQSEIDKQKRELGALQSRLEDFERVAQKQPEIIYKYQSLMDELEKLADKNVLLKKGSRGPAVGSLQKFLNIYNNTSSKIDNDYGAGTAKLVSAFQKDSGLTQNGEVGLETFNKMIDWLKEQK